MLKQQGKDYDPQGEYIKHWIPSLSHVPDEHIHHPWTWSSAPSAKASNPDDDLRHVPNIYKHAPSMESRAWKGQYARRVGEGSKHGVGNDAERVEKHHHHGGGGGEGRQKRGGKK